MAAKKKKVLCPHCGLRIDSDDETMVIHYRTHNFLYECKIANRTIFEHKSRLAFAIAGAGGLSHLRLILNDVDKAYSYVLATLRPPAEGELQLQRAALYAYLKEHLN